MTLTLTKGGEGVFNARRIETAVLLLLPVFVAAKMIVDVPLLLHKRPIYHIMHTKFHENWFTNFSKVDKEEHRYR
jgi:hypothetical protein